MGEAEISAWLVSLALIGVLALVGWLITRARAEPKASPRDSAALYRVAREAQARLQEAASPEDVVSDPHFRDGVRLLQEGEYTQAELLEYYTGDNLIIACMALEALACRRPGPDVVEPLLAGMNDVAAWTRHYALQIMLQAVPADQPIVGKLIARIDRSWSYPPCPRMLRAFIEQRVAAGEAPSLAQETEALGRIPARDDPFPTGDEEVKSHGAWLEEYLPRVGAPAKPLLEDVRAWRARHVDREALASIGTVWSADGVKDAPVPHPALERRVDAMHTELTKQPSRSVLLVGDWGTGKTSACRALGRRLQAEGWTIFEAGQAQLLAGMKYIGELEQRVRELLRALGGGRKVLWIVPDIHALSWAGQHQYDESSVLDYLLPSIERGDVKIVGETTAAGYQRLLQAKPRCRTALETIRFEALPAAETRQLARDWSVRHTPDGAPSILPGAALDEAWSLAQQFMGNRSAPGSLLELLSISWRRLQAAGGGEIRIDDLVTTLSAVTGLPASILDDRKTLSIPDLRETFESRVMGQPEAIDCLVERVTMIKAGLTDPTRPQGVFLLAGPTGTGKTEIAKALTQFLFGSEERMIRLDMSEFQDEASLVRILGDPQDRKRVGDSLVDQIRKQPFSVVLLDEFEKASQHIWDLFLQVFDDGRMTDRLGRLADFRHALILMTSNLGATIPSGAGLGFHDRTGAFSTQAVHRQVERAFRKEFLNRIDRVVVFRPLGRETMRRILRKELDDAFRRRGLRNRQWALELDEAAGDFLLKKGFTADLGARPLKRAVERYLLAPLARTIVDHRYPEGDQFLFVTSAGDELEVRFVDPDAGEPVPDAVEEPAAVAGDGMRLESLILSPRGRGEELQLLRSHRERLVERTEADDLHRAKRQALARVSEPDFWSSADRFSVLDRAEYLDRIEAGLQSASSMIERLEHLGSRRPPRLPRELVGRAAQQLWLLRHACDDIAGDRSNEVWLQVSAVHRHGDRQPSADEFARRVGRMYRHWGRKRGMQVDVLEESADVNGADYSLLLGVSGFAAWALLEPERGLHVWEVPAGTHGGGARRSSARVRIVPQPDRPQDDALRQARRAFAAGGEAPEIVRRYREAPSPLVRDLRRGWRTGLLDRVLDGDFDLIG